MSQNPFTSMFDAQRTAIKQSQTLTHDALEAQQTSFDAAVDAVEASESLVEQNTEFVKNAIHAYFDAVETNMPEESIDFEDMRALVDEQFDAATESQMQSLKVVAESLEESGAAFDEFTSNYAEVVDSSFDAYLDAHEQVTHNVDQLAENVEEAAEEIEISA